MFIAPTCHGEILDIINEMKPMKSKGHNEINTVFIRDISTSVAEPIIIKGIIGEIIRERESMERERAWREREIID